MGIVIKGILSIIISMVMQLSVINMVESTPEDAVRDFFDGLAAGDSKVTERYMENDYVNTLINVKTDEKTADRMYKALFRNFTYDIADVAVKDDLAVAKVNITCNDFTKVRKNYDKAAYKYVVDNLYKDKMADKSWLSSKCFGIYVKQIEKASEKDPQTAVLYVPLEDNGSYGWNIILDDEMMKTMLGGLNFPQQ